LEPGGGGGKHGHTNGEHRGLKTGGMDLPPFARGAEKQQKSQKVLGVRAPGVFRNSPRGGGGCQLRGAISGDGGTGGGGGGGGAFAPRGRWFSGGGRGGGGRGLSGGERANNKKKGAGAEKKPPGPGCFRAQISQTSFRGGGAWETRGRGGGGVGAPGVFFGAGPRAGGKKRHFARKKIRGFSSRQHISFSPGPRGGPNFFPGKGGIYGRFFAADVSPGLHRHLRMARWGNRRTNEGGAGTGETGGGKKWGVARGRGETRGVPGFLSPGGR